MRDAGKSQEKRKDSHLDICLNEDVDHRAHSPAGFDRFRFEHLALPEIDRKDIDASVKIFGKKLSAPLIIGAMTGGTERAHEINLRLITAAAACGVGFASGSQRLALTDAQAMKGFSSKTWPKRPPLYFGNIGAVQLNYGVSIEAVLNLMRETGCDAFNIHMNPLQECIQPEGQTNFSKLASQIGKLAKKSGVPVLLKEVGSGISKLQAERLAKLPLHGIETAGLGGTSWSKVESFRNETGLKRDLGLSFAGWGIPTTESILHCRKAFKGRIVIASGGLRNGIDLAKSIALGANAGAMAIPFLNAAQVSTEKVIEEIELVKAELKTVMFLVGAKNIAELRKLKLQKAFDYSASLSVGHR